MSQPELFEEKEEVYELFDHLRLRVVFERLTDEASAKASNEHFTRSLCPHLQLRVKQTKTYIIKR